MKGWGFSILTEKGIKLLVNLWLFPVFSIAHCNHPAAAARSLYKVWGKYKEPCLNARMCHKAPEHGQCGKRTHCCSCSGIRQPAGAGSDRQDLAVHSLDLCLFVCWLGFLTSKCKFCHPQARWSMSVAPHFCGALGSLFSKSHMTSFQFSPVFPYNGENRYEP